MEKIIYETGTVSPKSEGSFQRSCKRCLLRDMPESEYFLDLHQYIKAIPEDEKASDDEYGHRLKLCKECDALLSGMCRKCGCYVELRAAVKVRHCPDVPGRW